MTAAPGGWLQRMRGRMRGRMRARISPPLLAAFVSAVLAVGLLQWRHADSRARVQRSIGALDNMHQARLQVMRAYLIAQGASAGNATFSAVDAVAALDRASLAVDDWLSGRLFLGGASQRPLFDEDLRALVEAYGRHIENFRQQLSGATENVLDVEARAAFTALESEADAIGFRTAAALLETAERQERNHAATVFLLTFFILSSGAALHAFSRRRDEALGALEESDARLRMLMDQLPVVTWTTDRDLRIRSVGGGVLAQVSDGDATRNIGRSIADIPELRDVPEALAAHRNALESRPGAYIIIKDGRRFDVRVEPLRDHSASVIGVLAVALDMSEREKLEAQLRQAQKMEAVGRLAGGVAHDFNNLLTVIQSYTLFAADQVAPDSPAQEDLAEVRKAAERAAGLTRQLLAFSRQQILQPRRLDLNESVTRVMAMLRRVIGEDIRLEADLSATVLAVHADAGQMEQVLMNLAVNARDAMPDGGVLRLCTRVHDVDEAEAHDRAGLVPGRYAAIIVEDTGSGIPPDVLPMIFEPFYTTKGPGMGTGLGLSTVYGIVKQSGGYIYADTAAGAGSRFTVLLPPANPAADADPDPTPAPVPQRGTETILLVEDEPSVREVVRRHLEQQGYAVLEASSGSAALRHAEDGQRPIDLVLTDIVMPDVSGRALAEQLAMRRPELRVVFMSGYTDDEILRRGLMKPGMLFLEKPFTAQRLATVVRQALDDAR